MFLEWTEASQLNPHDPVSTLASQIRKQPQRQQNSHSESTPSTHKAEISLKGKPTFIIYAFGLTSLEEIIYTPKITMTIFVIALDSTREEFFFLKFSPNYIIN